MSKKQAGFHPTLERLAAFGDGSLTDIEAESLRTHLAECPLCRLELKRIDDFAREPDEQALAGADWDDAELAMQRAFDQKIRPTLRLRRLPSRIWLRIAPVAAAAVLLVAVLQWDRPETFVPEPNGTESLRGGGAGESPIRLLHPDGEIDAPPAGFAWESDREFDSWVLEVFTPDLEPVFRMPDLRATSAAVPDSLLERLEMSRTYLWNVQGRSGLADAELSLTGWFRIGKPAVGKL